MALTESTYVTVTTRVSYEVDDVDDHHDLCGPISRSIAESVSERARHNRVGAVTPFYTERVVTYDWMYVTVFRELENMFAGEARVVMSVDRLDGDLTMFVTFYWLNP